MEKRIPSEDSPLNGMQTSKYQQVVSTETTDSSIRSHDNDACLHNRRCWRRSFTVCCLLTCLVLAIVFGRAPAHYRAFRLFNNNDDDDDVVGVTIAFVGNSMFYFNGACHSFVRQRQAPLCPFFDSPLLQTHFVP